MDNETLINHYFEGNLTPQQELLFEERITTDPDFAMEVQFQKKLKAAITLESRKDFKDKLRGFENTKSLRTKGKTWLYIAASIVVLLGVTFFLTNQAASHETLYASYFEPYPNTVAPIVRSESVQTTENEAFSAYEAGNYKKAVQLFGELAQGSGQEYALFYKAVSLMMLEQMDDASTILSTTTWTENYSQKARWYLALCYLKQKEEEKTKLILREIVAQKGYNYEQAEKLLKKLN